MDNLINTLGDGDLTIQIFELKYESGAKSYCGHVLYKGKFIKYIPSNDNRTSMENYCNAIIKHHYIDHNCVMIRTRDGSSNLYRNLSMYP